MINHITPLTMDDFLFDLEQVREEKFAKPKTNSKGGVVSAGKDNITTSGDSSKMLRLCMRVCS